MKERYSREKGQEVPCAGFFKKHEDSRGGKMLLNESSFAGRMRREERLSQGGPTELSQL